MQIPRNSLAVQWLGLWALTAVAQVWSLVGGANILQVTQLNNNKKADSLQFRHRDFQLSQSLSRVLTLQPHGLQHARPPCPSPNPGVYSNSRPLSWWCHPAILCRPLFLPPSIVKVRLFLTLNLGFPCYLLWPIDCDRNGTVQGTTSRLQETLKFLSSPS